MSTIRLLAPAIAGMFALARLHAGTITERFSVDPLPAGWHTFGDTNLFQWDPTNQNLAVTWNSSVPNSYFYRPLGTILARDDDFRLEFDLRLDDIGPADSFDFSFQLAIGFLNLDQATQPDFLRGTGVNATNLVEFDYFRDDPFGDPATVYPTFIDKDGQFNYNPGGSDSTNFSLALGDWHHVTLVYTASNSTLVSEVTNLATTANARVVQPLGNTFSGSPFTDFRVNAFSISSYSEAGQFPGFEGSVLAHGAVDNVVLTIPPPPVQDVSGNFSNGIWQVQFNCRSNWLYTLERSEDLQSWTPVPPTVPGNGANLVLQDPTALPGQGFYRVRAERP